MRFLVGMIFLVIMSTQVSAVLQQVVRPVVYSPQPIFQQHHPILPFNSMLPIAYSQGSHQPVVVQMPTSFRYERPIQYQSGLLTNHVSRTPVQILSPTNRNVGPQFYSAATNVEQRLFGNIYGPVETACTKAFGIVTSVVPRIIIQVLAVVLLFPQVISAQVTIWLNPFDNTDLLGIFIRCFFPSGTARELFGDNPIAAVAKFDEQGSALYMAQMIARENAPQTIATIGRVKGLTPGLQYSLSVHETTAKDNTLTSCNDVGEKVQTLGTANFVGSQKGDAIIVIMEERFSLSSILSRSVVISPVGGGQKRCAIVRKQKPQLKLTEPKPKKVTSDQYLAHF